MFEDLNLTEIAYILKPHGVDGHVKIRVNSNKISKGEPVFIKINELPVPFFIEDIKKSGKDNYIIKLSFIDNIEKAESISCLNIYSEADNAVIDEPQDNSLIDYIGYSVISEKPQFKGVVHNINEIPGNPILEIQHKNKIIYVPFVDNIIDYINIDKKIIKISPPEGLIELYL